MTDYKQHCIKLLQILDTNWPLGLPTTWAKWADAVRADLAKPEPEGPTDDELDLLADCHMITDGETGAVSLEHLDYARAVLARWGRPAPQPANGEVAELVDLIRQNVALAWEPAACMLGNMTAGELIRAAELLEQLNPPQPVPVSERLPGPEDCDAEGRCWWFDIDGQWYFRSQIEINIAGLRRPTHWLPAHALPLPS